MHSMVWRDASGTSLEGYPRPSVAVDVALLTVAADQLAVLLLHGLDPYDGTPRWSLPGGFVHPGERLEDTVRRVLLDKCGIAGLEPRQLQVFDDPERDPRGWVMSVAHAATVPGGSLASALDSRPDLRLVAVQPGSPVRLEKLRGQKGLPFDHDTIVSHAVTDIRTRYSSLPDPDGMLGGVFSVRQLQRLHEAVVGSEWHKDAFRRLMEPHLLAVPGKDRSQQGPPAQLYRRRDDEAAAASPDIAAVSAGYTDGELLAAVAAYISQAERQTVEGYRTWARESGQPSDAWVRKRLGDTYGGWPGIVHAARRLPADNP
jgi:ADP-ribose pyrophosphatase YjhB (NUDIX family)